MATTSSPTAASTTAAGPRSSLTLAEIGQANKNASLDATLWGTCAGVVGGFLSLRVFRMSPKVSTFSGLATGVLSGYIFSQLALGNYLVRAEAEKQRRQRLLDEQPGGRYNMDRGESAPGAGLESLDDKYATTSGEH